MLTHAPCCKLLRAPRLIPRNEHCNYRRHRQLAATLGRLDVTSCSYDGLLEWASDIDCRGSAQPCMLQVANLAQRGRGLVAHTAASEGQVLLSVPWHNIFSSVADSKLHWSAEMAFRLLQERHACEQRQPHARWCSWLACLPQEVMTPLAFDEEDVDACQLPDAVAEIREMQECISACFWELEAALQVMGYGWEEFLWAVQLMHSRCFIDPSTQLHITVPGVDMANHSSEPTAMVRIVRSPGACQGRDALEDVAPLPPPEPSRFELVAGPSGIRAGEEVTISYGGWPREAFLLLFGFLPSTVPNDSLVLFNGLQDIAAVHRQSWPTGYLKEEQWQQLFTDLATLQKESKQDWSRLLLTVDGYDRRLAAAVMAVENAAARVLGRGHVHHLTEGEVFLKRACWLLRSLPTSLEQDLHLLQSAELSPSTRLAVQFRANKKELLQRGVEAQYPAGWQTYCDRLAL